MSGSSGCNKVSGEFWREWMSGSREPNIQLPPNCECSSIIMGCSLLIINLTKGKSNQCSVTQKDQKIKITSSASAYQLDH